MVATELLMRSRKSPRLSTRNKPTLSRVQCFLLALVATVFVGQILLVVRYRFSTTLDDENVVDSGGSMRQATTRDDSQHAVKSTSSMLQNKDEKQPSTSLLNNNNHKLPKWIQDYFAWHRKMRAQFPGKRLFEDPAAPPLLIRTCLGLCGGLNDRLGQLPWDLYLANQTRRVYLIRWERPKPLEHFLVPNTIDWSVPPDTEGFGDMHAVRAITPLFRDYPEDRPEPEFWSSQLDHALERANTGEFASAKILRHRLLGHLSEQTLEDRLRALGETDMIHSTPTFGAIFHALFRPSPGVETLLNETYHKLDISPGHYTAVHCRVRHPKATARGVTVRGKNKRFPADKTGLPWYGETKDFAVDVATHAIQCARTLSSSPNEPMYFFSDSNDLVHYVAHELKNPELINRNKTLFDTNKHDAAALKAVQPTNIVARQVSSENVHIDKQKGRDPPAYYGTFVDLYLAINARCVTYGIGFYAIFATKISGTQCKLLYQEEEWGGKVGGKATEVCTEDRYKYLL